MLINFCESVMKSKIKSDKVSFDGYEPTNLVADDGALKRKGFMSDHFVKPPIGVTVKFPCNVSIYRIVIDPVIGRQQSRDIRIFSAAERVTDSWLFRNDNNDPGAIETDGTLFNVIGNITNKSDAAGIICFQNSSFKESKMWQIGELPELSGYAVTCELRSRKPGCLCSVSHVTICVGRTRDGGSAAIKRLEIWGKPSANVNIQHQGLLFKTYEEFTRPTAVNVDTVCKGEADSNEPQPPSTDANADLMVNGVEIPEDFVDIITCNIMAVPMLLPCSKVIDQSTLERYIDTEASWGRAPNDPFTGIVFGPGRQPVLNAPLKTRLDKFLLMNSDKLVNVAQTLGRAKDKMGKSVAMKSSRLVQCGTSQTRTSTDNYLSSLVNHTPSACTDTSIMCNTLDDKSCSLLSQPGSFTSEVQPRVSMEKHLSGGPGKRKQSDNTIANNITYVNRKRLRHQSLTVTGDTIIDLTGSVVECANRTDPIKTTNKTVAHSDNLASSLDAALSETLGGLPSFTSFTKHSANGDVLHVTNHTSTSHSCCFCNCDLGQGDVAKYLLPCQHIACRNCLGYGQQSILKKCGQCGIEFTSDKLVRAFDR